MDDPRNNWQPVAELAELEQVHESTIRRNAVSIDELTGEEVYEQRPATIELNYCAHCGTKSYSETCPTCATAREEAHAC